ncbi:unnamed protein product, partial [Nezara viridula]
MLKSGGSGGRMLYSMVLLKEVFFSCNYCAACCYVLDGLYCFFAKSAL